MIIPICEKDLSSFIQYFSDESRKTGFAQSISFPECEEDAKFILAQVLESGIPLTIQGARTGLSGAAVPEGGHILSCIKMNRIGPLRQTENGEYLLPVDAGATMWDIETYLTRENPGLFWPPAPTESGATVGGVLASKARGIYAVRYGEASDRCVNLHEVHGLILSAELRLSPLPESVWGIAFFFPDAREAQAFMMEENDQTNRALAAAEFFNETSLICISELKKNAIRLNALPETAGQGAMVYVEIHTQTEAEAEDTAAALMEAAERHGTDPDSSWALSGAADVARIRLICHAAQEAALSVHDARLGGEAPGLDLALKGSSGIEALNACLAHFAREGTQVAVFGSLTGGRLRLCPLPESDRQREISESLLEDWKGRFDR